MLDLMAVPEDEGFSRGAASVQTRRVKKKKRLKKIIRGEGQQSSNAATLFLPKGRRVLGG